MSESADAPLRVLVVAYDFPPHGAIGTMRTLRLVRQLQADGWRVTVLTGAPATYLPGTPVDSDLDMLVPSDVEVLRVRALRPLESLKHWVRRRRPAAGSSENPRSAPAKPSRHGWAARGRALLEFVEALCEIPDKESSWILPAIVSGAWHMLRNGRPKVIYSSAPPWSGQVVALWLARLSGRSWVADFRDPWARAPWRNWRLTLRRRAVAALEKAVVARADAITFVTEANRSEFSVFYGDGAATRFHFVPNGCDPEEMECLTPLPRRDEFILLHAGTFYGPRSPMPVIEAIARAIHSGKVDRRGFRLRLLGPINLSVNVPAECRRLEIEDVVEFVPRVTRVESLREMKSASALLLVQIGTTVSVPGKAYEYLAAGRPVLALSEEGETSALVRASGIGVAVRSDAPVKVVEAALLEIVQRGESDNPAVPAELFDGRVHARTTERMLRDIATGRSEAGVAPRMALAAGAAAPGRSANASDKGPR